MFTSLVYCCYTILGNINFWFLDYFGLHVPSTKLFKWLRNVTIKSNQLKIFTVAYYRDVELNAGARDASSTSAITVMLTSRCKAVCQHTDVCIRQLSYCNVELLFAGPGLWPPVKPLWMKKKAIWAVLDNNCVEKLDIFQYGQPQYLTFVTKVIIMQLKFSQGSAVPVCRWRGQMNNCGAATYLSILCAKYYENRSCLWKLQWNKNMSIFWNTV